MSKKGTETLKKMIREEIKAALTEGVTDSYYILTDIGDGAEKLEMFEDDHNHQAVIKMDGKTIASYDYGGAGVMNVKKIDEIEICNALAYCLYAYAKNRTQ